MLKAVGIIVFVLFVMNYIDDETLTLEFDIDFDRTMQIINSGNKG